MEKHIKDIVLNAKNIAIVGLSPNPDKDSNKVASFLKSRGFNIIPIYPKEDFILDSRVYRDISEALKCENIDIIVVFRKSEFVFTLGEEILRSLDSNPRAKNLKLMWLQLGISNDEVAQKLESKGIACVQNKCIKIELEA